MPVGSQRHLFDVPEEIAYFNTANMSPLLHRVREAGETGLANRARPWEVAADDWFADVEHLRAGFAGVMGVSVEEVALVPATSYGLAVAARNVRAGSGDRVVVLAEEYPSNYYTWRRYCEVTGAELVVVQRAEGQDWTEAVVAEVGERTRVVAVPHVHWTNGALLNLVRIAAAAHEVGAVLTIDASQSLGAMPLDVSGLRPDFVVAVGYKWLLGPFGVGCLYVDERYHDGEPLEENWINRAGSEDFAGLVDYTDEYRSGARRFDVGERTNFGLVPMAIAATEQLFAWGIDAVASSLQLVTDEIGQRAISLGLNAPDRHGPHMLGIKVPREVARTLGATLAEQRVIASVRGDSLRIAPHLHATSADIERLISGLAGAL